MTDTTHPTRRELRDRARRQRAEHERARDLASARRRRTAALGGVVAAAAVVVAVLVALSGSSGPPAVTPARVTGARETSAMFRGVSQSGLTLGDRNAPVRVVEFADLQCPFCRAYTLDVLPGLVRDYVRPGTVRMDFRALAFIGPDSLRAARVVEAAGPQDRLWNVVDLLYRNQGRENSGYATDAFLRRVTAAVPGLDVGRVFAERDGAAVSGRLRAAANAATSAGVNETPTFLVGRGASLKAVDATGLRAAIQAALGR